MNNSKSMDFSSSSQQPPPIEQQQFQPDYYASTSDPSQIQSYYYTPHYQNYQNPPQMQDYSSYFNTQFVNGYDQHQQWQRFWQPELAPPGVSARPEVPLEGVGGMALGGAPMTESGQVLDQRNGCFPVLNPAAAAAVAVLAQITQIAGSLSGFQGPHWPVMGGPGLVSGPGPVQGAEPAHYGPARPMRPPGGRSQYRSGGRRGGGSFRGRGRGNIGNHPPRTGSSSHEIGRAQGTGGSGGLKQNGTSSSYSEPSAAAEKVKAKGEVAKPCAGEEEAKGDAQTKTPILPSGNVVNNQQRTRSARCELCKVDCNSLEILEQHKNGKRHKKHLQRSQLLENDNKPDAGRYKENIPVGDSNLEVASKPEITTEGKEKKDSLQENLPTIVVDDNSKIQIEQSNDKAEKPRGSGNAQSDCLVSQPGNQIRGLKRKMKGGRGRKRVKTADTPRGSLKPQKPKSVVPFICDLCNVRCDTKEVFDRHLSGKKHISKFKRFETHQAMYGPVGLQALYPPSSIAQNLFHQQGSQQIFYSPHGSNPPLGADVPPPSHNAIPAATPPVSGLVPRSSPQMLNGTPQFVYPNAPFDTQQRAALFQPEPNRGA